MGGVILSVSFADTFYVEFNIGNQFLERPYMNLNRIDMIEYATKNISAITTTLRTKHIMLTESLLKYNELYYYTDQQQL
jgi:hypothetical protein